MLTGKKILVVGAAGLLGVAVVRELLELDAQVVAADLDREAFEEKILEKSGGSLLSSLSFVELDLLNEVAVKELFSDFCDLSGVVNCAYPRNSRYGQHFYDVSLDGFNDNVSMNLGASFLLMQECAKYFKRTSNSFSFVNVSSIYGIVAPDFTIYNNTQMTMPVEYAAIKSALIQLSKYVTKYVGDSQFRVNIVSPGGILDQQPENFLDAYQQKTLGKGMLDVEDVVGTISYLLSDKSRYVNGQNIVVDDGFVL